MIQILVALLGGFMIVIIPYFLAQAALRAATRIERIFYAACVAVALIVGLYIIFSRPLSILGILVAVGIIYYLKKRAEPDLIIGESLLNEAVTPEMGAELEELGAEVLKGNVKEAEALSLRKDLVDEDAAKRLSE